MLQSDPSKMNFSDGSSKPKAWKEIWGCGQGIGTINEVTSAGAFVEKLHQEYVAAKEELFNLVR